MNKAKAILKAVWEFCSFVFVPQWGRNGSLVQEADEK